MPRPTSNSGSGLRLTIIMIPCHITAATATAIVTGSSRCCIASIGVVCPLTMFGLFTHHVSIDVTISVSPCRTWPARLLEAALATPLTICPGQLSGLLRMQPSPAGCDVATTVVNMIYP